MRGVKKSVCRTGLIRGYTGLGGDNEMGGIVKGEKNGGNC